MANEGSVYYFVKSESRLDALQKVLFNYLYVVFFDGIWLDVQAHASEFHEDEVAFGEEVADDREKHERGTSEPMSDDESFLVFGLWIRTRNKDGMQLLIDIDGYIMNIIVEFEFSEDIPF